MKTNRTTSLVLTLALLLFLASAMAVPSRGADYTKVGVKNGDWVSYSYTLSTSRTPGSSISGTARMDITQVSGTNVTVTFQATYSGQSATQTYSGDISTGSGGICSFVIAAGLSAGDPLYIGAPFTITETPSMYMAGASRTVNHYAMSQSGVSFDLYFDKETGLLLKESLVSSATTVTIEGTSTSAFSADPTSLLIIGGIGVGAVAVFLIAIVAYSVSRRRRQVEQVTIVPVTLAAGGSAKPAEAPKQYKTSSESVCPFCGAMVVAGAAFCGSCGTCLTKHL